MTVREMLELLESSKKRNSVAVCGRGCACQRLPETATRGATDLIRHTLPDDDYATVAQQALKLAHPEWVEEVVLARYGCIHRQHQRCRYSQARRIKRW